MTPEERLERYARLAVEVGSNVGEGQVALGARRCPSTRRSRARSRAAPTRSGARYVDVDYTDQHVRRARIQHAPEETLGWTPPWMLAKIDHLAEERGALIQIAGDPEPELLADLDGARVGKTRMRELAERYLKAIEQAADQLGDRRLPERGLGASRFRRAGRRAALGCRRLGDAARRARSGRGLARAHRQARRARRRCSNERALRLRSASAGPAPTSPSG